MAKAEEGCCGGLKNEFKLENFCPRHAPASDFLRSQWQKGSTSIIWLLYRWALAISFCSGVFGSMVKEWFGGKWLIYLTHWGFFMCMLTSVVGCILVTMYHINPEKFAEINLCIKIYWVMHFTTCVVATLISTVYWTFLFPTDTVPADALFNLWAHGFNSINMILDFLLIAFPTRILHIIYPFIFLVSYALFTVIYYVVGGTDIKGHHYIYSILNWEKPEKAMILTIGCSVFTVISTFFFYGLYKLRVCIANRVMKSEE